MLTIKNRFGSLAIIGGLIGSLNFVHAQTLTKTVQPISAAPMDSIIQIAADSEGLSPLLPEEVPPHGTFWTIFPGFGGTPVPMPCPPFDSSFPIYAIADGQFLVDETGGVPPQPAGRQAMTGVSLASLLQAQADAVVNLITQVQAAAANRQMQVMAMGVPTPGGGGDGGTNSYLNGSSFVPPDYGTNLWIANFALTPSNAVGMLKNSSPDIFYEIQVRQSLSPTDDWASAGFVYGSEVTNWTALVMANISLTNDAFFRIRSWEDDGSGLPIWWQMRYFSHTGVDPYEYLAGDGWNNLEKFLGGMDPNVFYPLAAPRGLTAFYNVDNTATVSWLPSSGPVTGYTVERDYITYNGLGYHYQTFNVSAGTTGLHDATAFDTPWTVGDWGLTVYVSYKIQAHYAGGDSVWSGEVQLEPDAMDITLAAGPQGSVYLAARNLPVGTTALRLTRVDWWMEDMFGDSLSNTVSFYIPLSTGTNGLYLVPTAGAASPVDAYGHAIYRWFAQPINANGQGTGQAVLFSGYNSGLGYLSRATGESIDWVVPPYFDGRVQLKQNLIFLLRAATVDYPFYYNFFKTNQYGCEYVDSITNTAAYVYSGFDNPFCGIDGYAYTNFDVFSPFENNYAYRNFVFSLGDLSNDHPPFHSVNSGHVMTGAGGYYQGARPFYSYYGLGLVDPDYKFTPPTISGTAIGAVLATNQTQWLCSYPLDSPELYYDPPTDSMVSYGYLEEIGVTPSVQTDWYTYYNVFYTLPANARNFFGLPFLSAKIAWGSTNGPAVETNTLYAGGQIENGDADFSPKWYFYPEAAQPQFQTVEYDFWSRTDGYYDSSWDWHLFDSIPGEINFVSTNASNAHFIMPVGGSTQIAGYAKLAVLNGYPGVYAYLGQYFDQAYKMNTNGIATTNTTGVLSPYGQFFATEPGPAALVTMPDVDTGARGTCTVYCISFQLDKNHDGTMDLSFNGPDATSRVSPMVAWVNNDDDGIGIGHDMPVPTNSAADYTHSQIRSQRNLEDFFRLWICGLPKLPPTNGYAITLSMSPSSGNPAVNLYWSCESDGGMGYLTVTNIASLQTTAISINGGPPTGYGVSLGTVSNNCPYTFPDGTFQFGGTQHFLFEGAGIGEGQLTMTIAQNGNTIAQTGVWLDLHDVKDFYERAVITNIMSGAISNWTSVVQTVQPATASAFGDDQDLIVFVHGINVSRKDWLTESDTVFKRLYWAGYHGKFMTVRWPCNPINYQTFVTLDVDVFNDSELKAYKAGTAMKSYLSDLHSRFPGDRLNLFVHSQGNPVVSEAIEQGAPFDTYILTQGALPDSAYDVNAPTNADLVAYEAFPNFTPEWQPMGYHGVYTNLANLPGRIVNFYNPNDPVLAWWVYDQKHFKPDSSYSYNGTNTTFYGVPFHVVTDPQESRANVSRSRTFPIGQSGPESAHGVLQSAVDLNAQFNFNDAFPADHSAQWAWPIQTTRPYYLQVLESIKP